MMPKVLVEFDVTDREKFLSALQKWGHHVQLGQRVPREGDVDPAQRPVLQKFAALMEAKLRKNDHKTNWRELPIEGLFRQMLVEIEEFKVAYEFLPVISARDELVDIANYAMIVWDRLHAINIAAGAEKVPAKRLAEEEQRHAFVASPGLFVGIDLGRQEATTFHQPLSTRTEDGNGGAPLVGGAHHEPGHSEQP